MPSTRGEALQRLPELAVEDLDVPRRCLALMRDLTVRPDVRKRMDDQGQRERRNAWLRTEGQRGIQLAIRDAATLRAAGVSRAELMTLATLLIEVIDELCGDAPEDRLELERANMELDAIEDALQARALLDGETPQEMIERAGALRREGAAKLTLARHLEGLVRRRTLGLQRRAS